MNKTKGNKTEGPQLLDFWEPEASIPIQNLIHQLFSGFDSNSLYHNSTSITPLRLNAIEDGFFLLLLANERAVVPHQQNSISSQKSLIKESENNFYFAGPKMSIQEIANLLVGLSALRRVADLDVDSSIFCELDPSEVAISFKSTLQVGFNGNNSVNIANGHIINMLKSYLVGASERLFNTILVRDRENIG